MKGFLLSLTVALAAYSLASANSPEKHWEIRDGTVYSDEKHGNVPVDLSEYVFDDSVVYDFVHEQSGM